MVCKHRAALANSALFIYREGPPTVYKFIYASQSPYIAFLALCMRWSRNWGGGLVTGESWKAIATGY
jgi:hypothetical protein